MNQVTQRVPSCCSGWSMISVYIGLDESVIVCKLLNSRHEHVVGFHLGQINLQFFPIMFTRVG